MDPKLTQTFAKLMDDLSFAEQYIEEQKLNQALLIVQSMKRQIENLFPN